MMNAIARFLGTIESTPVVNASMLEIKENPELEAKRAAVKARMKDFGRKSMLEGGTYSRKNTCLKPNTN